MEYVIIAASIVLLVVYFILFLICLFGIDRDDMREAYKDAIRGKYQECLEEVSKE